LRILTAYPRQTTVAWQEWRGLPAAGLFR